MTPFEIWLLGFLGDKALWFADKVTGSIVSEFVKRTIFGSGKKQADKSDVLVKELEQAVLRYNRLNVSAETILDQKEILEGEVIRLRVANLNLQKENQELRSKIQAC